MGSASLILKSNFTSKIYAIGGFDGKARLRTIEEYDIEKNEWRILPTELQAGLTNSAAVAINSTCILVFGGG